MRIELPSCTLRSWTLKDARSLARYANNRRVWLNLRDAFPHPYTELDARRWLAQVVVVRAETHLAIEVGNEAVGSVGFRPGVDVERISAEIGYWLGERFWGRGIMTDALRAATEYAFRNPDLQRIFAVPFAGNTASCRVLEKAGYCVEGRLRHSAIKDGVVTDQIVYASYARWDETLKGDS